MREDIAACECSKCTGLVGPRVECQLSGRQCGCKADHKHDDPTEILSVGITYFVEGRQIYPFPFQLEDPLQAFSS